MKLGATAAVVSVLVKMDLATDSLARMNQNAAKAAGDAGAKAGSNFGQKFGANMSKAGAQVSKYASTMAAAGLGALFAVGNEYDNVQDTIRAKMVDSTKEDLASIQASFDNVAKAIPAGFDEIANSISSVAQMSGLRGSALEDLTGQILNLQNITKQSVNADGIVTMVRSFNIPVDQAAATLDKLYVAAGKSGKGVDEFSTTMQSISPIARQLGLSFDDTAALVQNLVKSGVDVGTVFSGLRKYQVTLAKEGKDAAKELPGEIARLQKLAITAPAQAVAEATKFFGKSGVAMVDAMAKGTFNLADASEALSRSGGKIKQVAGDNADGAEAWKLAMNKLKLELAPVGTQLLPVLTDAIKSVTPIIIDLFKSFNSLSPATKKNVVVLMAFTAVLGPTINAVGKTISGISSFISIAGKLGKATKIMTAIQWLWNAAITANPIGVAVVAVGLLIGAGVLLVKNWSSVKRFFLGLWDVIKGVFGAIKGAAGYVGKLFGGGSDDKVKKPAARATGGSVSGGAPYLVGEKGPEIMVPRAAGTIIPNYKLGAGTNGSDTYNIVVNNPVPEKATTTLPRTLRSAGYLKGANA